MSSILVTQEDIQGTENGSQTLKEIDLWSIPSDKVAEVVSKEYARLVQDNPEYDFWIVRDILDGAIQISWRRRISVN